MVLGLMLLAGSAADSVETPTNSKADRKKYAVRMKSSSDLEFCIERSSAKRDDLPKRLELAAASPSAHTFSAKKSTPHGEPYGVPKHGVGKPAITQAGLPHR